MGARESLALLSQMIDRGAGILGWGEKIDDQKMKAAFYVPVQNHNKQGNCIVASALLALLTFSLCIGTGLLRAVLGSALVHYLYARTTKTPLNDRTVQEFVDLLSRLITFDLYRGNITLAAKRSRELLSSFGAQSDLCADHVFEGLRNVRLQHALTALTLLGQARGAIVVSLIIGLFFS